MDYFIGYLIILGIFWLIWCAMVGPKRKIDIGPTHNLTKHSCANCYETNLSWYQDGDDWHLVDLNGREHECKDI